METGLSEFEPGTDMRRDGGCRGNRVCKRKIVNLLMKQRLSDKTDRLRLLSKSL